MERPIMISPRGLRSRSRFLLRLGPCIDCSSKRKRRKIALILIVMILQSAWSSVAKMKKRMNTSSHSWKMRKLCSIRKTRFLIKRLSTTSCLISIWKFMTSLSQKTNWKEKKNSKTLLKFIKISSPIRKWKRRWSKRRKVVSTQSNQILQLTWMRMTCKYWMTFWPRLCNLPTQALKLIKSTLFLLWSRFQRRWTKKTCRDVNFSTLKTQASPSLVSITMIRMSCSSIMITETRKGWISCPKKLVKLRN